MKITEYLRDKYGKWGWMGQRAHDAVGINRILPLDFIISCDYGIEIPQYFREIDVFSVEKQKGIRKNWSNEDLSTSLKSSLGREILEKWNSYRKRVNLLCYRSVRRLENGTLSIAQKPAVYAVPERLKKRFDNKILLHKNLLKLSLPKIPGRVDQLGNVTFGALRKGLSLPFVIQFPYGSSGLFTFIIREEKEYRGLRKNYPDSMVVIRRYIDGFSLNVNGVIFSTENGAKVACSFPSVQITGVPECSNFPSAFCGNDYTAARDLETAIIKQVENHICAIGGWMAESGFRGVFGMDFVVKDGVVYPVEINPRFQNSTSLYTTLSNISKVHNGTLFLLHIAEFLQNKDKMMKKYIQNFPYEDLMRPLSGSQIILHNRMHRNVVTGELIPGIYRLEDRSLKFIRKGASLETCRNGNDILITSGVPRSFTIIEPNAPICKVQMFNNALDPAGKRKLTNDAKKIVASVYKKLALKEVSRVRVPV